MPEVATQPSSTTRSPSTWNSACGNIYYRRATATPSDDSRSSSNGRAAADAEGFPVPLIGPRRARPHAIHIVTYPSGYIPRDLRKDLISSDRSKARKSKRKPSQPQLRRQRSAALQFQRRVQQQQQRRQQLEEEAQMQSHYGHQHNPSDESPSSSSSLRPVLGKLFASFVAHSLSTKNNSTATTRPTTSQTTNGAVAASSTPADCQAATAAPPVALAGERLDASAATAISSHSSSPPRASTSTSNTSNTSTAGTAAEAPPAQAHCEPTSAAVVAATGIPPNPTPPTYDVIGTRHQRYQPSPISNCPHQAHAAPHCSATAPELMHPGPQGPDAATQDTPDAQASLAAQQQHNQPPHLPRALPASGLSLPLPLAASRSASAPASVLSSLNADLAAPLAHNNGEPSSSSFPSSSSIPAQSSTSETCRHHSRVRPRTLALAGLAQPSSPSSEPEQDLARSPPPSYQQDCQQYQQPCRTHHHHVRSISSQDHSYSEDPRRFSSHSTSSVPGVHSATAHDSGAFAAESIPLLASSPRSATFPIAASSMAARIAVPPYTGYGHNTSSSLSAAGRGRGSGVVTVRPPPASAKSSASSVVTEVPKPVASGSGVSCSILLAEPTVFLSGFDHDSRSSRRQTQHGTALLRGKLRLSVSKNVKIKAVQLKLVGRARTEWPEGIPPLKQELFEEESLRTQVLTFFNAMYDGWESDYGNQCTYKLKESSCNGSNSNLSVLQGLAPTTAVLGAPAGSMTAKDLKRLSLQNVQSRSFGKGDGPQATTSQTQAKGFKVFYPGVYDYSFELPIDHHQLETAKLQYGSVKWELHATVDRAGAFKPNLHGTKEVLIARIPDQLSLEMTEPISISRQWEDQLHYDIVISGKSFPIGSKIPIAFKLTPLAKVQIHKLRVYVTESVEYWTNDRRVTRRDPGRKILLLEKSAGKPLDDTWATSDMRTLRGGELSRDQRREAREMATQRRALEASRRQAAPEPLPEPTENLLGDLDLGLESFWGSTEIEANVQLPTCEMMAKNKDLTLHPDCSWKNVNVYHWIKIVLRLSRIDPDDPSGTKRRHFEISIDSPFTVLNCRAIQANTHLPAYSNPVSQPPAFQSACGCPDAASVATVTSPSSSTGTLPGLDMSSAHLPTPPQAAHVHVPGTTQSPTSPEGLGIHGGPRPMHLLRVPSFNPPAFDDDTAPPPHSVPQLQLVIPDADGENSVAMTPPPQYDVVVGTPSVDGLADYFARLADYGYDEDSGSDVEDGPPRILGRTGRVNVAHPRTPGGRMPSRSMEISRRPTNLEMEAGRGNGTPA